MSARVVVLISGTGSNMAALLEAAEDPGYGAAVVAVGSDRENAAGLAVAEKAGVPVFTEPFRGGGERAAWNADLAARIASYRPDLVVSAGFMRILGREVLDVAPVVNLHPALLPSFPGAHAVRDALAHGVRVTGSTVHFVDEGVDTGPIIDQVAVRVEPGDDEASLHARIKAVESRLLVETVGRLVREGRLAEGRQVRPGAAGNERAEENR
ncbi:phosphoribosylglycinamide formyltransferase [Nocardiopsis sp. RSe5-2]|uniref:Phosphoribosylglycinamide formyltransferase n=1 Tax=Nocardiopsis endophytica TaxID=3018445 RepID=A0ABT4UD93_9ACTN|nr:phosphoribosylglycinamide formyltransferase [Nocardiopsis endophytica]MDA2814287.1 phosphoribosylglycinamide formyltransferase [Nocardiopsis endophytica]